MIKKGDWITQRPRRRMPRPHLVAAHWELRADNPFVVDTLRPACFCCQRSASAWSELERAHLVDRQVGGPGSRS